MTKLNNDDVKFLALVLNTSYKSVKNNIKKLEELKWVRLNLKINYYHIVSLDKLRDKHNWESRASIEFFYKNIINPRALLGAALYGYLHKDFWRKVKREKIVLIKGRTFHFLSPSFNFKNSYAPVSVIGVNKLFNISQSKASRVKYQAKISGLIKVKKDYTELPYNENNIFHYKKYNPNFPKNVILRNGKYYLEGIDLILPCFFIRKRKKLGT